jgi:transcriptional regulator with XRE-family HTH domain
VIGGGLHAGERGMHSVLNSWGQRVGPLRDGLRLDADCLGGGGSRSTEQIDGCTFIHAALNHASELSASIVYGQFRKVAGMEFGDRLVRAMSIAHESRDGLSKALGISVQAISQVINGTTRAMTAENTLRAARHLRVSAWWLATGEGSPQGARSLAESLTDEAISYAVEYDAMTPTEKEQFKMLLAVAIEGRRHLGGISNFGALEEG